MSELTSLSLRTSFLALACAHTQPVCTVQTCLRTFAHRQALVTSLTAHAPTHLNSIQTQARVQVKAHAGACKDKCCLGV